MRWNLLLAPAVLSLIALMFCSCPSDDAADQGIPRGGGGDSQSVDDVLEEDE